MEIRRLLDRYAFSYRSIKHFFSTHTIQIPRTLDNTREADETIVTPEDEEVLADETTDEFSDYFLRGKIPNIMVTTRPKPSTKLYDFVKELMTMIPNVSYYARLPEIRSLLLSYQRGLPMFGLKSGFSGMIMDGRDIGSVVLPNADLKFFLHADLSIRESRRTADGESSNLSKRDSIDTQRKIAPLVCPDGAISLDTGILPINKVVSRISDEIISIL